MTDARPPHHCRIAFTAFIAALVVASTFGVAGVAAQPDSTPSGTFDEAFITVDADANQTISGSTSLSAGAEVKVSVTSTDDTQPRFFTSTTTTVDENGDFSASFDFPSPEQGGRMSVSLYYNGTELAQTQGYVGDYSLTLNEDVYSVTQGENATITIEMDGLTTAKLLIGDGQTTGYPTEVLLHDANEDGTVTIRFNTNATGAPKTSVITAVGEDNLSFDHDDHQENVSSPLATGEYHLALGISNRKHTAESPDDVGTLFVEEPPTPTETMTDTATATPTDTEAATTSTDSPGFGIVVAIGALLAVAAVIGRRL